MRRGEANFRAAEDDSPQAGRNLPFAAQFYRLFRVKKDENVAKEKVVKKGKEEEDPLYCVALKKIDGIFGGLGVGLKLLTDPLGESLSSRGKFAWPEKRGKATHAPFPH